LKKEEDNRKEKGRKEERRTNGKRDVAVET
jgi:hypothetical protein